MSHTLTDNLIVVIAAFMIDGPSSVLSPLRFFRSSCKLRIWFQVFGREDLIAANRGTLGWPPIKIAHDSHFGERVSALLTVGQGVLKKGLSVHCARR